METSDSECFESADEDFNSDFEEASVATTKAKKVETKLEKPLEKCTIKETAKEKAQTSQNKNKNDEKREASVEKVEVPPPRKKDITKLLNKYLDYDEDESSPSESTKVQDKHDFHGNTKDFKEETNTNTKKEEKVEPKRPVFELTEEEIAEGFGIPPDIEVCCEPGVDYPMEEYNKIFTPEYFEKHKDQFPTMFEDSKSNEAEDLSNENIIEQCWEPGVDYPMEEYNKVFGKKETIKKEENSRKEDKNNVEEKDACDDKITECSKPEIKQLNKEKNVAKPDKTKAGKSNKQRDKLDENASNKQIGKSDKEREDAANKPKDAQDDKKEDKSKETNKKDRGFAIPPKIAGCWEPGANYPMEEYNKIFKKDTKKEEKLDGSGEPERKLAIDELKKTFGVKTDMAECSEPIETKKTDNTRTPETKTNKPVEETDGWGEEDLWNDDELNWGDEKHEKIDKKSSPKQEKVKEKTGNFDEKGKEDDMWGDDDMWNEDEAWEPVDKQDIPSKTTSRDQKASKDDSKNPASALDNLTKDSGSGWGSWGGWGLSTVLSTATASVSTLTSHVSQGISTVLESGMGVPDPEELARLHREEAKKLKTEIEEEEGSTNNGIPLGLGNLVSGVSNLTKFVEKTGSKVITGGLDTLETIGKKTMEVLQENDPDLKKKIAFLKIEQNRPILSQILREAKEKAEEESKMQIRPVKKPNYESIFDDYQGLVHLEALEMLSKQCDIKLQSMLDDLSGNELTDLQETFDQVKDLCELPEEDEDEVSYSSPDEVKVELKTILESLDTPVRYENFINVWEEAESWLENCETLTHSETDIHKQAIETLAHLTAISVEFYHKIGELLLVKERRSTADEADSLVHLTQIFQTTITKISEKFSGKLTSFKNNSKNENVNELITNVFYEAANSCSYVKNAFQLTIPVLQKGTV